MLSMDVIDRIRSGREVEIVREDGRPGTATRSDPAGECVLVEWPDGTYSYEAAGDLAVERNGGRR